MCTKSPLLKNKGHSKLIKKEVFKNYSLLKWPFFWEGAKLLQVRTFYTMNKVPNESFLKLKKNYMPVYTNVVDSYLRSF